MTNSVCAVVVTRNRLNLLKECLYFLEHQSFKCDIFVVNNNSDDGTEDYLNESGIYHYTFKENTGGAGGFNKGLKEAVLKGYKYIWLMDDDCIPNIDALEKLMEADRVLDSKYGFLASKVLWTDGEIHNMNKVHPINRITDNISLINQATFVSLLIQSETVKKVGLPIKDFFIWGDDIEYTRRISIKHNMPSYYIENSVVAHKTKNNIGSKIAYDNIENIGRYRYAYRNEAYLYKKEGIKGIAYYFLKVVYNFMRIVFLSKDNRLRRIRVLFEGFSNGLMFNPNIEYIKENDNNV